MGARVSETDVVCIGETMALFRAETSGPLTHARGMTLGIGGSESNVAIALTRLGRRATWVGALGADSLGELVLHELRGEGVHVIAPRHPTAPTGLMIKARRTPLTQQVSYYRKGSAGSLIEPDDVPGDIISRARILHVTGITPALSSSAAQAIDHAIAIARDNGVLVSFDINYRTALWRDRDVRAELRPLLKSADVVFAGADEAALVVGPGAPEELAARLAELGPQEVVVKLGGKGALALVDGTYHQRSAVPITAIDTVGAGDAFVAGYLAELLEGERVDERLRTAVRVGAFACLVPGDWEGLPTRADLELLDSAETVAR
jgi:2-dehydro-3-deoxygluconokinase